MLYKLHTTDLSPYGQRVCLALALKGLTDETKFVDTFGGTAALRDLAPMAQIPILEGAHGQLPESQVIVDFLEDRHPEPPLVSSSVEIRSRQALITRLVDLYVAPHTIALITAMRGKMSTEAVDDAMTRHARGIGFVDYYLNGTGFAVGADLSIADLAYGPFLFYAPHLAKWHDVNNPLSGLAKSHALLASLYTHPIFAKVFEKMETAFTKRRAQFAPS